MVHLCSALVILGFLSLLRVVPCNVLTKLTSNESEHNAEHCGYNFINGKNDDSSDGDEKQVKQELFINQYPWIATIRVRGISTCDGALISPRHVVTAARCVVETSPKGNCEKRDILKLRAPPEEFTVQVGSRCTDPKDEFCADMWIKAKEVACHEDFDECTFTNDIAVVELEEDVNSTAGIPICMPGDSDQVQKSPLFISSAFGQSRGQKGKHKTPYHVLRNYYLRTKHKHIHTAVPPKIRICESDMGGPLFNKGETSTLMGIASHGNTCDENVEGSDQDPWDSQISADDSPWNDDEKWDMCELKYVHTSFVDLRSYRRWICSTTGVCSKDAESASDGEVADRDACENSGSLSLNSLKIFVLASMLFIYNI